jgi:hypothetical protein
MCPVLDTRRESPYVVSTPESWKEPERRGLSSWVSPCDELSAQPAGSYEYTTVFTYPKGRATMFGEWGGVPVTD